MKQNIILGWVGMLAGAMSAAESSPKERFTNAIEYSFISGLHTHHNPVLELAETVCSINLCAL